jgi:hypothetical protein
VKRAAQALIPPLRRMNRSKGSESSLYAAAYRIRRDHLLLVRLSAFAGSAVHRMIEANERTSTALSTWGYCRGINSWLGGLEGSSMICLIDQAQRPHCAMQPR